jgi:hydrogenase expression/formation protein HypC
MCLAIPGQIKEMPAEKEEPMAAVEVSGVRRKVNVDLLREDGLACNDWVLIHVGFAMSKISEEEARDQLQLLETLGETEEAMEEMRGYGSDVDPFDGRNPFAGDFPTGDAGGDGVPERGPPEAEPSREDASEKKPLEDP